jgi:hypothetical protein|tara:strand:- start:129 stop:290 length:162 start_codon:yes stop_codon:yes gene_type:complete
MTEVEQQHAQAIDLTLERINRLEKEVQEMKEMIFFVMRNVNQMAGEEETQNEQ